MGNYWVKLCSKLQIVKPMLCNVSTADMQFNGKYLFFNDFQFYGSENSMSISKASLHSRMDTAIHTKRRMHDLASFFYKNKSSCMSINCWQDGVMTI